MRKNVAAVLLLLASSAAGAQDLPVCGPLLLLREAPCQGQNCTTRCRKEDRPGCVFERKYHTQDCRVGADGKRPSYCPDGWSSDSHAFVLGREKPACITR